MITIGQLRITLNQMLRETEEDISELAGEDDYTEQQACAETLQEIINLIDGSGVMRTVIDGLPDDLEPGRYTVAFDGLDTNGGVIYFKYIGQDLASRYEGFTGPPTADNAWYEAYADAVHSLNRKWPDVLTPEQEEWCAAVADRYAPRPEAGQ